MAKKQQVQERVSAIVHDFAANLTEVIRDAIDEAMGEAMQAVSVKAPKTKRASPNSKGKRQARAHGRKRGQKRTPEQIAKDTKRVFALIKKEPGLNAEGIRDRLNIPTRDLKVPINRLFDEGKIEYDGQARGVRYYPA